MREFGTPRRSTSDPTKSTLFVPIGVPAAGKSTWSRDQRHMDVMNTRLICPDDYRQQVYGTPRPVNGLIPDHEKEVWRWAYGQLNQEQKTKHNVIFDATNLSQSRRTRLRNIAPNHNHIAVFFESPLDLCLSRNAAREYPVPEHIIEDMHRRLIPPSHDEQWDDVWVISPTELANAPPTP